METGCVERGLAGEPEALAMPSGIFCQERKSKASKIGTKLPLLWDSFSPSLN